MPGSIDQLVPSQRSITPRPAAPTAKQKFARGHEMPFNDPIGWGVGMSCQLVPSQCSTMGVPAKWVSAEPTAMHDFADEQSTPFRTFTVAEMFGVGVGVTVQAADAAVGVSSKAAVASNTRRTELSGICSLRLRLGSERVKQLWPTKAAAFHAKQ